MKTLGEKFQDEMKLDKTRLFIFLILNVPETHPLFEPSHVLKVQNFHKQEFNITKRNFFGGFFFCLLLEKILLQRNLMMRLTRNKTLGGVMFKYLVLPLYCSFLGVNNYVSNAYPELKSIGEEYDFTEEKFKNILDRKSF